MNSKLIAALCLLLAFGFAASEADDYVASPQSYSEELPVSNDEKPKEKAKTVVEDENTETSALVQNDNGDSVALKHKGFCHWGVAVYYKPGFIIRCSCLKCTCQRGGKWDCAYNFAYCPYYYCGNQIYNPLTQICCCGKVHDKKASYSCCGYFYYYTKTAKCCNYYSVKPIKSTCPRYRV